MNQIKRYQEVINNLIKNSFPTLVGKKIELYEEKDLHFSADSKRINKNHFRIRTHKRLKKYPKNLLIGLFAHELSHLEYFESINWFNYEIIRDFKLWSKKYKIKDEKNTDLKAIEKGYARQLYAQRLSRFKEDPYNKSKYLYISPEEVKLLAKRMGKW